MNIKIGDVIYPKHLKKKSRLANFFAARPGVSEDNYRMVVKLPDNTVGLLFIDENNAGTLETKTYNSIHDLNETDIYEIAIDKTFLGFKILRL